VFVHGEDGAAVVKVLDFGIAKLLDHDERRQGLKATRTGMIVGTPIYIAPERLRGEAYDGRADVYSVGVMAYELRPRYHKLVVLPTMLGATCAITSGDEIWIAVSARRRRPSYSGSSRLCIACHRGVATLAFKNIFI